MRPLYHAVAAGMYAYSRTAFRVAVLGPTRLGLPPGTLLLATHRRETDVPVICPALWRRAELYRHRVSFAARDDMFLPGFFAGFAPELGPRTRQLLYPVSVGRFLPRVEVRPIRSASVARLGEVLREAPGAELEGLLGEEHALFAARAAAAGLAQPRRAAEVLRGEYADLLWRPVTPADSAGGEHEGFWARRAAQAAQDFRALVDLVRSRRSLLLFPEGRPSPDGELGPLQRGLAALVRRARPVAVSTVTLGYDPLVRGRTRVALALSGPLEPPTGDVEAEALRLLRRALPLTAGQLAAVGAAEEALEMALAEGRPVEPDLLVARRRAERLAEARAVGRERPDDVAYLRREFESARA